MTVESNQVRISYTGDGSSVNFPIPWLFYASTDLLVLVGGAPTIGWSASGQGNEDGGLLTMNVAPAVGVNLQIVLNPPQTQEVNLVDGIAFPSLTLNQINDRIVQIAQRLQDQINRCIRAPDGDANPQMLLPAAAARAALLAAFDGAGNFSVAALLPAMLSQIQFNTFLAGSDPYKVTLAEQMADVDIINPLSPPMSYDRYGTNTTPGTTDMVSAINAAVSVAMQFGGQVGPGTPAQYLTSEPINATFTGAGNHGGLIIRGYGGIDAGSGILAAHSGNAIIDATGNDSIVLLDVVARTMAGSMPACGFLTARQTIAGSPNIYPSVLAQMFRSYFIGTFGKRCYANVGSELDILIGNYFWNLNPAAGTGTRMYSANNIDAMTSPYTTIATGPQSCTVHLSVGNRDNNSAGTSTSDLVTLEQADSYMSLNDWGVCDAGRSLVAANQINQPSNFTYLMGLRTEPTATAPRYNVYFGAAASTREPVGWKISALRSISSIRAIAAEDSNTNWNSFWIDQISEATAQGISLPGQLKSGSILITGAMLLNIGNVETGCLILGGPKSQWTFGSQSSLALDLNAGFVAGWGTPTGQAVISNFPGASASLGQTSSVLAELLTILKSIGLIGA